MKPLVSILIPCYNASRWLRETLESALAQTWQEKEIIIVDDGSTDQSLTIAKSFESKQVKVIQQSNQGASAARNRALQIAQGDFIQYLDADDLLAPDKIEQQIQGLATEKTGFVAAGEWARFYKTPSEALFIPQPLWSDFSPVEWLICAWEKHLMMHPAAWLVPRHLIENAGSWNESLSLDDDGEYFCRVVLASQGIKFCWGAKSYYRSGNLASLSGSKSHQALQSAFRSIELSTNALLERENSPRTRHACATKFQRFIYEVYPEIPDLLQQAEQYVQHLGCTEVQPMGGLTFQFFSRMLGWKLAKRIQNLAYHVGYNELALGWRFFKLKEKIFYYLKLP